MLIRNLVLATSVFLVTLVLGILIAHNTSLEILSQLGELLKPLKPAGNFSLLLLLIIFVNNAIKALGAVFFGILLGFPPLVFISLNGFIIGGVVSAVKEIEGLAYAVVSIAPHGIIEIPAILVATALGLTVGSESVKWLARRESHVKSKLSYCLKLYLRWVLPGLAVAALIEVFVTPWLVGLVGGG